MKTELKILIDEEIVEQFDMALLLNKENTQDVFESMMKSYISRSFSKVAALYDNKLAQSEDKGEYYGKALHKIPKWAKKPSQAIYKIIRAYFELAENGVVYESELNELCSDRSREDVYMASFKTNFAQMKIDSEKSYGKVFEVSKEGIVTIWEYVENQLLSFKEKFLLCSTDIGYINANKQKVIAKTNERGTDHCSIIYRMKCTCCGCEYDANSTNTYIKKCPSCQGGVDTGAK